MRINQLLGLGAGFALTSPITWSDPLVRGRKPRKSKPVYVPHPAMPEEGWPETRQQRRARERSEIPARGDA